MKHTETPWRVEMKGATVGIRSCEAAPRTIALLYRHFPHLMTVEENYANANFIVQAVNAHADLLQALKAMSDSFGHYCEGDPSQDEIDALALARAAIAKSQGVDK